MLDDYPDLVTIKAMGEGFTWDTQDRQRDLAAARNAWAMVKQMMAEEAYHMVIADELNIVLRYNYLPIDEIIETLKAKRADLHVVVTGATPNPNSSKSPIWSSR